MIESVRGPLLGLPPGVDPAAAARVVKGEPASAPSPSPAGEPGFKGRLDQLLGEVNSLDREAAHASEALVRGEPIELHEVMVRQAEAKLAFTLLLETRNRLIEAYQEIMRMPV
jgi:flagellar hook-basal body complex protein FliE